VNKSTIVITGVAGFIGMHVAKKLLDQGHHIVGIDNLSAYYDVNLKKSRLNILYPYSEFEFHNADISDKDNLNRIFLNIKTPPYVINLAAQPGVRYSIENPYVYVDTNICGFINILECCRIYSCPHLVYASSSSVYGGNKVLPFSENHNVDHPVSLYAATKRANELMAHTYSHLFHLRTTGLRFFTVYGPWGRPDMSLFSFTKSIIEGKTIKLFNHGLSIRDFTYIDDIVEATVLALKLPPQPTNSSDAKLNPSTSWGPFQIINIGNNNPVSLVEYIRILENSIGKKAIIEFCPAQMGDLDETNADTKKLQELTGFVPKVDLVHGINQFTEWYRSFYNLSN
jgi:UDP-glucuronate 4-epimerase